MLERQNIIHHRSLRIVAFAIRSNPISPGYNALTIGLACAPARAKIRHDGIHCAVLKGRGIIHGTPGTIVSAHVLEAECMSYLVYES